jgi:hypothetical protein
MSDVEMLEWILKLYNNLVQITGIKHRRKTRLLSLEESAILGNDSAANFNTPNQVGNSSTMTNSKDIIKSP